MTKFLHTTTKLRPTPSESERHLAALHDALETVHQGSVPHSSHIAWPPGLSRSVLGILPLQNRTSNCIESANLMNGDGPLTVGDLLGLKSFGRTSLRDLLLTVESLHECTKSAAPSPGDSHDTAPSPGGSFTQDPSRSRPWDMIGKLLSPLLAAAVDFHGAVTLADVLDPRITRLASAMGLLERIKAVPIEPLVDDAPRISAMAIAKAARIYEGLTETGRTIVDHRILASPPKTLEKVGLFLDITRERVRQIQAGVEAKLKEQIGGDVQVMAMVASERLGSVAGEPEMDRCLRALSPGATPSGALVRQALRTELAYTSINGVWLDAEAVGVLETLRTASRGLADDAGLVDEKRLLASLPNEEWHQSWPLLRTCCDVHEFSGSLALRDSSKARVKAALISIGQPATREEVASVGGVSPTQAAACMSSLPSVIKTDKTRWGITGWVDDEYNGIVDEILQRIEAGGGVAAVSRILEEIPNRFGVSEASVRAFLQTPKFVIRDGHVTVSDESSVQLKALDEVIDGRDRDGNPYWTFTVQERHHNGYSLTGVPPEFAAALGCPPDDVVWIPVSDPTGCRDLSVRWRLTSLIGATIGYIADPLRRLGVRAGHRVRITIRDTGAAELAVDSVP